MEGNRRFLSFLTIIHMSDILQETKDTKNSFISKVFSTTDEDKGELWNVAQYALMAVIPVVSLNKLVQRFIPEADPEKSSIELLAEIAIQLVIIFCGLVLIHRAIVFVPTYSGFKYENLAITNVILAFMVIVFSIQSKIGLKANIIVDRIDELWNGYSGGDSKDGAKRKVRVAQHSPSQADYLDNGSTQNDMYPPAPIARAPQKPQAPMFEPGPMAANGVLGGAFGSAF